MLKVVAITLLIETLLSAKVVSQNVENSIIMEAILFVVIFGTMGLISYIYSSRHAKAYKPNKKENKEKVAYSTQEKRILELEEMLQNKTLTQKEFEILKSHYLKSTT